MWGRRKDNNQPYIKTGKKGQSGAGSSTEPVADVHLKQKQQMKIAYRDILGREHHSDPSSLVVQTILFSKKHWTKEKAIKWLKEHDHATYIDEKEDTYRARQVSPSKFKEESYETFHPEYLENGIQFVGGKLKR